MNQPVYLEVNVWRTLLTTKMERLRKKWERFLERHVTVAYPATPSKSVQFN